VGLDVRKSDLRAEFEKFAPVQEVYIKSGRAFVTFESPEGVEDAIREVKMKGFNIKIKSASRTVRRFH